MKIYKVTVDYIIPGGVTARVGNILEYELYNDYSTIVRNQLNDKGFYVLPWEGIHTLDGDGIDNAVTFFIDMNNENDYGIFGSFRTVLKERVRDDKLEKLIYENL